MKITRDQITWRNIKSFIQGYFRYFFYYSKYPFIQRLLPRHIKEQIDARIKVMRRECFEKGYCVECGCKTTALQMARKSCDGNCYPPMVSRKIWKFMNSQPYREFYYKTEKGIFVKR